jgi:quercetin dioxygenase-like cupin family protein
MVMWEFEPPQCGELPDEIHEQAQCGVVLEGEMVLHLADGVMQPVRAGEHYTIEPGTVHGAHFVGRTTLYDVYTPPHEGFESRYRAARDGS